MYGFIVRVVFSYYIFAKITSLVAHSWGGTTSVVCIPALHKNRYTARYNFYAHTKFVLYKYLVKLNADFKSFAFYMEILNYNFLSFTFGRNQTLK